MSGRGDLPRWLRALAWLCLRVYPRDFRRDSGADYRAVIAHRWALERRRYGGVAGALRTAWLLLIDTAKAGPAAHSASLRQGTDEAGGTGRLHRLVFWRDGVVADTRVAVRSVVRRPGLSALVVVTFGLGIGANLALFGALDRVVLRPLPFPDGDRMVYLALRDPVRGWQFTPTLEALARWREGARTLEWVELYLPGSATLTGAGPAELLQVTHVSARLAAGLGVRALVGRVPGDQELTSSAPPQVLLSDSYWRREFGADAGVVGSALLLNDTLFTVAGVWPAAARLELSRAPDLWRVHRGDQHFRPGSFGYVLALVRKGAGVAEVEAELAALAVGIEGVPAGVLPAVNPPYGFLGDEYVRGLWLVFGGVVVLLLAALVNAANLLLNRAVSRAGELGVRAALGASRLSLLRLFLAEGAVLTALGLLLAAMVGRFGGTALAAMVPERLTVLRESAVTGRLLLYASALALTCVLVCAAAPMFQLRRSGIAGMLSRADGGRSAARSGWGRDVLVAAQVALAVVLVAGAALTLRSFRRLLAVDTGMAIGQLAQFALRLPPERYPTEAARSAFWRQLVERVEDIPGVQGVATAGNPLMRFSVVADEPLLEGATAPAVSGGVSYANGVSPDYFQVTGTPVLHGDPFAPVADERVVVVNRAFAARHGGDVVGRRLVRYDTIVQRIVAVVGDVSASGLTDVGSPTQVYSLRPDPPDEYVRFIARTSGSPAELLRAVRGHVAELDPGLPFREITTGIDIVREATARQRFVAQLLAVFSALTLLLAVTAVYGVVMLNVSRRTREIGIRMALGAGHREVIRVVLWAGFRPVVSGALVGVVAALAASGQMEAVLYRVSSRDPLSFALGILVLFGTAALACAIPARRASRISPVDALRSP